MEHERGHLLGHPLEDRREEFEARERPRAADLEHAQHAVWPHDRGRAESVDAHRGGLVEAPRRHAVDHQQHLEAHALGAPRGARRPHASAGRVAAAEGQRARRIEERPAGLAGARQGVARDVREGVVARLDGPELRRAHADLVELAHQFGHEVAAGELEGGAGEEHRGDALGEALAQRGDAPLGHVGLHGHEARRLAALVVGHPRLDVHPVLLAAAGVVGDLDLEGQPAADRRAHVPSAVRVGAGALQERPGAAADDLRERPAGEALEAVVDPDDAPLEVGDDHRVAGTVGDLREALQLQRDAPGLDAPADVLLHRGQVVGERREEGPERRVEGRVERPLGDGHGRDQRVGAAVVAAVGEPRDEQQRRGAAGDGGQLAGVDEGGASRHGALREGGQGVEFGGGHRVGAAGRAEQRGLALQADEEGVLGAEGGDGLLGGQLPEAREVLHRERALAQAQKPFARLVLAVQPRAQVDVLLLGGEQAPDQLVVFVARRHGSVPPAAVRVRT